MTGWTKDTGMSYEEYADAGKMPRYEGVVYGPEGNSIWRFDRITASKFKCHNCETVLDFSREAFREHGKTCNESMGNHNI
jgi:hypothetical protein